MFRVEDLGFRVWGPYIRQGDSFFCIQIGLDGPILAPVQILRDRTPGTKKVNEQTTKLPESKKAKQ